MVKRACVPGSVDRQYRRCFIVVYFIQITFFVHAASSNIWILYRICQMKPFLFIISVLFRKITVYRHAVSLCHFTGSCVRLFDEWIYLICPKNVECIVFTGSRRFNGESVVPIRFLKKISNFEHIRTIIFSSCKIRHKVQKSGCSISRIKSLSVEISMAPSCGIISIRLLPLTIS